MAQATYDDANLLLRLYELRREEKLREARAWFFASFKPKSLAELQELCPPGTENNARMRMVASYWEMAASFVTTGVLSPELFFLNNREMLVVALRLQYVLAELRSAYQDPTFLKNLESVGRQYADFLNRTAPGTLEATLTVADLADVGTFQVTVANAAPGGGSSAAAVFTVMGVVPSLTLLPSTGGAVGGGFTLGVHGSGFTRASIVRWNGVDLATDYRSGRRLFATVPDALMRAAGIAAVAVFSPGPGGGTSPAISFTIRQLGPASGSSQVVQVLAADVAFSDVTRTLFATVRAADSLYPNRLVEIDPATGAVARTIAIGTDPRLLAMAGDGKQLYVGVDGQNAVRRIDVSTFVPGVELALAADGFFGPSYAADLAVLPGRPMSIAVTQYYRGVSPPLAGTTIFDDATARPNRGPSHTGGSRIEFAGSDSLLFGYNNLSTGFNLFTFSVDASGLQIIREIGALITGFSTEIVGASGRIYATNGAVVDAERQSQAGTISAGATALYIDASLGRAFAMFSGRIDVIDINTFSTIGSVPIAEAAGGLFNAAVYRIVRCGPQCLAWADGSRVVIARSAMFGV